jgi:hypothetical protein
VEAYDRIWSELRDAAVANDTHAWRFAGVKDASIRLEFLEFAEHSDPRALLPIRQLLSRLEREVGPAEEEEWAER